MIYPKDNVKVYLITDESKADYSDGTISIDVTSGIDEFQTITQTPDVGQLTLITRNTNLDPHINSAVRHNSRIQVDTGDANNFIFYGFITDVSIEYDPAGKENIVTINAVNIWGLFQRSIVSESFATFLQTGYPTGVNLRDFLYALFYTSESDLNLNLLQSRSLFWMAEDAEYYQGTYDGPEARIRVVAGDNILDIITKLCNSNFYVITEIVSNIYYAFPYSNYSTLGGAFAQEWLDNQFETSEFPIFSSDGNNISYKSIQFDDGFGRTLNQIVYNNHKTTPTIVDTTYGPYINTDSISDWGLATLTLDTVFSGSQDVDATYENYATTLLQTSSVPSLEVKEITFNNAKEQIIYLQTEPYYGYKTIRIQHKVNESITVDKFYAVVGIKHNITPYAWETTYILQKHPIYDAIEYQGIQPSISVDAPTGTWEYPEEYDFTYYYYGDSNNNFTATITNIDEDLVDHVDWVFFATPQKYVYDLGPGIENVTPYATTTGLSYTFNHDVPIGETGTGGYPNGGPGVDQFRAIVHLTNGWKVWSKVTAIQVTAAETHAGFTYTQSYGTVNFTDTSYDAQSWSWNFGDGNTSTLQNPSHHYAGSGTYNVTLTVSNGVDTDSITIPVTITVSKIVVNYIKFEWKGTANLVGGVWNKEWLEKINYLDAPLSPLRPSPSVPDNLDCWLNVEKSVVKGNVYKQDGTTIWPAGQNTWSPTGELTLNADQVLTDYGSSTSKNGTYVQIKPLITNSGNTKEYDVSLIVKVREGIVGGKWIYPLDNTTVDNSLTWVQSMRLYFYKNSWTLNKQYQPINVYVSADNTTWYPVGSIAPKFTSYIPAGVNGYGRDSLVPTVPMPPMYP